MSKFMTRFFKDESGATAIEYGLIAALVGVMLIGGLQLLEGSLTDTFTDVSDELDAASTAN